MEIVEGPAGHAATVDAIVVPTIRSPEWLLHAADLAWKLGCPLVSLHSRTRGRAQHTADLMPDGVRYLAVDLTRPEVVNLPTLMTSRLLENTIFHRTTDLSVKRNAGLVLARLMGWERIVFLDDDITVGGHRQLLNAVALLDRFEAVGMNIGGFHDNSVVCHAHRKTGGDQSSFIGGGALAVHTMRDETAFFPNVYNEDWFYLLEDTKLRSLAITGEVSQRKYDPYDRPERARDQEFGDVLAEGIYWLLDAQTGEDWRRAADHAHWTRFLRRRKLFIENVLRRSALIQESQRRHAVQRSLLAALHRLNQIEPEFCVRYLDAWAADRERWAQHLRAIPLIGADETRLPDVMKWMTRHFGPQLISAARMSM
ncbi:hypothetical protein [Herbidospora cretacea]|uniref:hypothetical protein n=1 Tax=Herbidospora cretacea TaxID=28444 RepID=UPI0007745923|nr:hypothetical protein [Herbidospora cretacea]